MTEYKNSKELTQFEVFIAHTIHITVCYSAGWLATFHRSMQSSSSGAVYLDTCHTIWCHVNKQHDMQ
jgi:NADH:ubiquinone oxidoreductase subunit E